MNVVIENLSGIFDGICKLMLVILLIIIKCYIISVVPFADHKQKQGLDQIG